MDKTSGKVIMWVLTVLAALLALLYFPSRGSFIILLGVVLMIENADTLKDSEGANLSRLIRE